MAEKKGVTPFVLMPNLLVGYVQSTLCVRELDENLGIAKGSKDLPGGQIIRRSRLAFNKKVSLILSIYSTVVLSVAFYFSLWAGETALTNYFNRD